MTECFWTQLFHHSHLSSLFLLFSLILLRLSVPTSVSFQLPAVPHIRLILSPPPHPPQPSFSQLLPRMHAHVSCISEKSYSGSWCLVGHLTGWDVLWLFFFGDAHPVKTTSFSRSPVKVKLAHLLQQMCSAVPCLHLVAIFSPSWLASSPVSWNFMALNFFPSGPCWTLCWNRTSTVNFSLTIICLKVNF